ncbi:MIP/aquaporin family protein [Candidatus Poriferisocius sp.]|uniref:MIP/aquaporin family protein n=1 Tax=Candidatus Poriferisocius sp. TaxID=3101276 RepID=UPI003B5CB99C
MLTRKLVAEGVGTALLLIGVVGSGIMAERLSPTDVGLQLFQNAAATAAVLFAIILMFGPVSGAHFNPAVTLADWALGDFPRRHIAPYIAVQVAGAAVGTILANLMFDLDAVDWSTKDRSAGHLWLGEVIATAGLVALIFALVRTGRLRYVAGGVAAYIGGAYYFTSSTSFANPAVTVGRMFSDTFAGIEPSSAPMFIVMQIVGLVAAVLLIRFVYPQDKPAGEPVS